MNNMPYEKMLNQIAELMQFAFDHANEPISPEKAAQVEAQLADLEKKVKEIEKATGKIASDIGLSEYAVEAMREDPQSQVQKVLKRAQELKEEAAKGAQDPQQAARELQEKGKRLTPQKSKKPSTTQGRKRKFRSMGGEQDWKPV